MFMTGCKQKKPDMKMIMQVHDELVFEMNSVDADELIEKVKSCMNNAASLDVPLIVDVGRGKNWDEAH